MPSQLTECLARQRVFVLAALLALGTLAGCVKKGGEAIVMGKEHVEATEIQEASPGEGETAASPTESSPRMTEEQWVVSVQMVADQRWLDVRVDKARWENLKEGDRVKVTYREGKYTGTAWGAEIR